MTMPAVTYKDGKTLVSLSLSESQHKAWRKFKRTLAIKEPCKESKIIAFAAYLEKHTGECLPLMKKPLS